MKNEDIYNGVTEIRDDLIDGAARGLKKRQKKTWLPAAVAAALALTVGAAVLWSGGGGDTADGPVPPSQSQTAPEITPDVRPSQSAPGGGSPVLVTGAEVIPLAAAVYPEQAPYTSDWGSEAFDRYQNAYRERWEAAKRWDGSGDGFLTRAAVQFLSGDGGENRVVSPLNLYMALAMVAETTDGNSRAQILDALGAADVETLREQASALWNAVYRDDGAVTAVLANSFWLNSGLNYVPETLETLAERYYASSYQGLMGSEEYNQALRDWINRQTGGRLSSQVQGMEMDPRTVLALVSTVYYRAKWYSAFSPELNQVGTFHSPAGDVSCDFMHQETHGVYAWGDRFTAVSKPFEQDGTMWFILPNEGVTPEELLSDPQALQFLQDPSQWTYGELSSFPEITLTVPKFDVSSDLDLIEGLKALGITDVFDWETSDFSSLIPDMDGISITRAQHAARVTVDEEGCEAAAFTAIQADGMGGPLDYVDFTLDRPFLFLITSESGLPLFVGIVNQPA